MSRARAEWTASRPRLILVTRKHRCACRGMRHRVFGMQHDCWNVVYGARPPVGKPFCSSCPCPDFNERTVLPVVPA